jgi:hypothetical protein
MRLTIGTAVLASGLALSNSAFANEAAELLHPKAAHNLPSFVTAPGQTDVLMVVTGFILLGAVVAFGILFLRLHALPEHIAHGTHKVQMELVSVLCLIALFTHMHIFWIAGLVLAFIDIPDFGSPLRRIAASVGKMAGGEPDDDATKDRSATAGHHPHHEETAAARAEPAAVKPSDGAAASPKKPAIAPTKKEVKHA